MHSVTASPVSSMCTPPRRAAFGRVDVEGLVQFGEDVLEVASLDAVRGGSGVAVHGIAAPQHGLAGGTGSADQCGQAFGDAPAAEAVNQGEPSGFVIRVKDIDQRLQAFRAESAGRS